MGQYRDELVDQARYEAQNIAQRAQSVAGEALKDVKEEPKTAANKTIDEVTDESKRAAQRVTNKNTKASQLCFRTPNASLHLCSEGETIT